MTDAEPLTAVAVAELFDAAAAAMSAPSIADLETVLDRWRTTAESATAAREALRNVSPEALREALRLRAARSGAQA